MKKYYDNPNYNVAFEQCIDLMAQLMVKHGPKVLEQQRKAMLDMYCYPEYKPLPCKEKIIGRLQAYNKIYQIKMTANIA